MKSYLNDYVRDFFTALGREAHATGVRALEAGAAAILDDIDERVTGVQERVRRAKSKVRGVEGFTKTKPRSRKRKPQIIEAELVDDETD